ncbi:MAG: hypothetical protein AAGA91_19180 [Pseudomonadota bacterium]
MLLFEYIAIAFSMVFSFTVLRLVGGLPYATRPGRVYWVHLLFVMTALIYVLNAFWAFWSYATVEWTYARYILALASPIAQYFTVAILVPGEPHKVTSWRDYYYASRRRFFIGLIIMTTVSALSTTELADMPLRHPVRLGQLSILTVGIVGLVFQSPRVQAALALVALIGVAGFGALILALPGGLS